MLHVPVGANTFGGFTNSWGTSRPSSTLGTSVTSATGAKGSWANVISTPTSDAAYGVLIWVHTSGASSQSRNYAMDIGVDEAGGTSYTVRIPDLLVGGAGSLTAGRAGVYYYFPLYVPPGSTIGARAWGSVTTAFRVGVQILQQPANPSVIRKGSFVEAYGVTASAGTSVTPGTTSEGAWTSLGTTSSRVWWWQVGYQITTADTTWGNAAIAVDLAVGDGSNFNIIISDMLVTSSSAEALGNPPIQAGVEFPVPSGTGVYVRAQHSGTVDNPNIAAYALGG